MISSNGFTKLQDLLARGRSSEAASLLHALQAGYFALLEEIQHLRVRISSLEELTDAEAHVRSDGDLVWFDFNGESRGPCCPLCHDTDGSLISLENRGEDWFCPSCQSRYARQPPGRRADVIPFRKTCRRLGL